LSHQKNEHGYTYECRNHTNRERERRKGSAGNCIRNYKQNTAEEERSRKQ
jgi:hypothetical protein